MKQLYVPDRDQWREWLSHHYKTEAGIWLIFYKKGTSKPTIDYDEAVEEALCFGWIDSLIKEIDDEKYARKFTPRWAGSRWSELNKQRIAKLRQQGHLTEAGLSKVKAARASGLWNKPARPEFSKEMPQEFGTALAKNKKAKDFFDQLAPSYRKQFIGWIASAKRAETRARRIRESLALLERGQKLGMK